MCIHTHTHAYICTHAHMCRHALILRERGDFKGCLFILKKILEDEPRHFQALLNYARLQWLQVNMYVPVSMCMYVYVCKGPRYFQALLNYARL